jgi:hypothetical protein
MSRLVKLVVVMCHLLVWFPPVSPRVEGAPSAVLFFAAVKEAGSLSVRLRMSLGYRATTWPRTRSNFPVDRGGYRQGRPSGQMYQRSPAESL